MAQSPDHIYEEAVDAFKHKDLELAEGLFEDAANAFNRIANHTSAAKCLVNRGIALRKLERPQEALTSLQAALKMDPTYTKARFHIAKLYDGMGRTDVAYRVAKQAWEGSYDPAMKKLADELYHKLNKRGGAGSGAGGMDEPDEDKIDIRDYYHDGKREPPMPPGPQQAAMIQQLMEQQETRGLQTGDHYYAVDARWWRNWCAATGYDGPDKAKFPVGWKLQLGAQAAEEEGASNGSASDTAAAAAGAGDGAAYAPVAVGKEELALLGPIDNERLCLRQGEESYDEEELARRVAAKARKAQEQGTLESKGDEEEDEDDGGKDDKGDGDGDDEADSGQTAEVIDCIPGTDDDVAPASSGPPKPILLPPRIRPGASLRRHFVLIGEDPYKALRSWYGDKAMLRRAVLDRAAPADGSAPPEDHFPDNVVDLFPERRVKQQVEEREMQRMGVTASAAGGGAVKMDDGVERSSLTNRSKVLSLYPRTTDSRNVFGMDWKSHRIAGAMGLRNLGNTCFMNSALQCVKATWPLSAYLLADLHKIDENPGNVLGTKCNLSREYAFLVNYMHYERGSSVAPTGVKSAVGRFRRDFAGFQQHDSHELLSFLLDAVHEDLNRVRKKPATTKPEGKGKEDDYEVAEKSWATHLQRNDSIVTDCMMGLLRSELTCPNCSNISVQFDPYTSLSLPIAGPRQRKMALTVQPQPKRPREVVDRSYDVEIKIGRQQDYYTRKVTYKKIYPSLVRNCDARVIVDRTCRIKQLSDSTKEVTLDGDETNVRMYSYKEKGNLGVALPMTKGVRSVPGKHWLLCTQTGPDSFPLPVKQEDGSWAGVDPFDPSPEACEAAVRYAAEAGDDIATRRVDVEVRLYNPVQRNDVGLPRVVSLPGWASPLSFRRRYAELLAGAVRGIPKRVSDLRKARESAEAAGVPEADEDEAGPGALLEEAEAFARSVVLLPSTNRAQEPVRIGEVQFPGADEGGVTVGGVLGPGITDPDDPMYHKSGAGVKLLRVRFDDELRKSTFDAHSYDCEYTHPSVKVKPKAEAVSLDDCMDAFCTPEVLDAQNEWYCSGCKSHVRATKHMQPWKLPDILVVHLKRFSSGSHYYARKLEDHIDFPLVGWDLTKHNLERKFARKKKEGAGDGADSSAAGAATGGAGGGSAAAGSDASHGDPGASAADDKLQSTYDCYGVVNHFGSMGFGHYTAYANHYVARYGAGGGPGGGGLGEKRHSGNAETANASWLEFDDSRVSDGIRTSAVKSNSAYILFYRRRGAHMP